MMNMHSVVLALSGTTLALVACMAILFTLRPRWGLALFIFVLPFERIGAYPLNPSTGYPLLHPAQLVGAALIAAVFWRWIIKKDKLRPVVGIPFLIAFLVTSLISAAVVQVDQVWQIFVWLLFIAALLYTVAQLANPKNLDLIRKSLSVSVLVVSLFGIYQFFGNLLGLGDDLTGIRHRYGKTVLGFPRLQSTALEPLYFANYLMLPLFVLAALMIAKKGFDRLAQVALAVGVMAFALTFSRSAALSAVFGIITLTVVMGREVKTWLRQYYKQAILATTALIVGSALVLGYSVSKAKSNSLGDYFTTKVFKTGSYTERQRDQKLAIDIWKQHKVFGVGIGGFGSAYYGCQVGKCVYRPNNQALEVLAEGGLIGFITFHLFLLALIYYGWRALKQTEGQQRAIVAGLMAAEVSMVVQSQTFSGFLCCLTYTWATLALLAGLSSKESGMAKGSH